MRHPKFELSEDDFHSYDEIDLHMPGGTSFEDACRKAISLVVKTGAKVSFSLIGDDTKYTLFPDSLYEAIKNGDGEFVFCESKGEKPLP